MGRYASDTTVSVDRTRSEIERTLVRYGATEFGYISTPQLALVAFRHAGIPYRIELPIPDAGGQKFRYTSQNRLRSRESATREWDAEVRRRWRVLLLLIKAKLEAVEIGNSTMQREFLADTILPGGETVGRWAEQQLRPAIESGRMPRSMLALPEATEGN